jgi:hypothetical protein
MTPERPISRKVDQSRVTTVPLEFHCSDCGAPVALFLPPLIPRNLCISCQWLSRTTDPDERKALRERFAEIGVLWEAEASP